MKQVVRFVLLVGASSLVACASLKPEDYGLHRVAIAGQAYYCAPRSWVLPSWEESDRVSSYADRQTACLPEALWPMWLELHNAPAIGRHWPITPGAAEALADSQAANSRS
jgi:hypothetical protein